MELDHVSFTFVTTSRSDSNPQEELFIAPPALTTTRNKEQANTMSLSQIMNKPNIFDCSHVIIDFETLSLHPNAWLLQCGVSTLHYVSDVNGDGSFWTTPDTVSFNFLDASNQEGNRHISPETHRFWRAQPLGTYTLVADQSNAVSFESFAAYLRQLHNKEGNGSCIWGYGALADLAWLDSMYADTPSAINPWSYRRKLCLRTLIATNPWCQEGIDKPSNFVAHTGASDAEFAALALRKFLTAQGNPARDINAIL